MPLTIADGIEIPDDELTFTASRSGGPGGQHVNKTASKVTLRFDVSHAPSLPDDIRARLLEKLSGRIEADGTVRVVCQASRSQFANRKTAETWVNADAKYLRCSYRHKVPADSYAYSIGFRIAYSPK